MRPPDNNGPSNVYYLQFPAFAEKNYPPYSLDLYGQQREDK